jgi:pyrroline-5-carboxylate reductase
MRIGFIGVGNIGNPMVRASAHRDQPDRSIVITRIGRS